MTAAEVLRERSSALRALRWPALYGAVAVLSLGIMLALTGGRDEAPKPTSPVLQLRGNTAMHGEYISPPTLRPAFTLPTNGARDAFDLRNETKGRITLVAAWGADCGSVCESLPARIGEAIGQLPPSRQPQIAVVYAVADGAPLPLAGAGAAEVYRLPVTEAEATALAKSAGQPLFAVTRDAGPARILLYDTSDTATLRYPFAVAPSDLAGDLAALLVAP